MRKHHTLNDITIKCWKNNKKEIISLEEYKLKLLKDNNNNELFYIAKDRIIEGFLKKKNKLGEITFIYYDCKKNGRSVQYYNNGKINVICNYNDNLLNGLYEEYSYEGKKIMECNISQGFKNGKFKKYFPNGSKHKEGFLKYNKLEGKFTEYYNYNGNPKIICEYKNNKLEGKYEEFDYTNNKIIECYYCNDELNGKYKLFENNKKRFEIYYKKNQIIDKKLYDDKGLVSNDKEKLKLIEISHSKTIQRRIYDKKSNIFIY
jgi:antitoxin component YwqK of YwqJK toxin-antitoxin module